MDQKLKISEVLKKYTMIIALAVIVILFTVNTGGKMLLPQNVNNLIAQNAYVFILATGMLFCILTEFLHCFNHTLWSKEAIVITIYDR